MHKKEIINNGYRKKRNTKIATNMIIFLLVLFTINTVNTIHTCSATTSSSADLTTTEKIVEERFVDNDLIVLDTKTLYRNSIVHININVLPQSNSSVEIYNWEQNAEDFSPALTNFTLVPGDSFAENYTFIGGVADVLGYLCHCTLDNSNATVLWWYEVLFSAKPSGFIGVEFLFISGSLFSAMILIVLIKQKSSKKND